MKPLLMDMNGMSNSKEVYESRPHPFFVLFIYLVLSIIISFLIWAYLCKIDIVIKYNGILKTSEKVLTITNEIEGQIEKVKVNDGDEVKKGDIIYVINHDELATELKDYSKNLSDVEDRLLILNAYLDALNGNINNFQSLQKNVYFDEYKSRFDLITIKTNPLNSEKERLTEINTIYGELKSYKAKKNDLLKKCAIINKEIKKSTVIAKKDGSVNFKFDIVEGNKIHEGEEPLTIIPKSKYLIDTFIDNKNIGKIKEGMQVKIEFYSFPVSEYGLISGKIKNISKDIKINDKKSSSYYIAKTTLDNNSLYNKKGKEEKLKVGMNCEVKVITGKKRVLFYILEKINLLN
ncbi:HlyD family secretion protein [Anaerosacchariphilus polymeriproducens]|uniref:HlyD family efflux transporter periplasmic adaptor subunit n=1 Tax=Anaerosacchariphilus polymeriproducens TaxID=1812858 RepID=A0A371AXU0_9FIRM|nr:HlyD family efflux transporter periplasmic adaptor subunit [Anaerosacchariphilus polymeriproducens]RDU24332.1 HlyD family efflux transporter periplasmic adaptor subunit [Anaerosacchariphilus polymeriproducens]